jgi:two-component system, OmpR family, sensor histidine kinase BaeS
MQTLARVDDDPGHLHPSEIALHDFVREVAVEAGALLDGRLTVLLPAPHALVRADPERLRQALLNLLSNAADHGRGDGRVELRVLRERDAWRFEVADEPGLPHDDADFRLHRAAPTAAGLAVARGVAEAHGGSAGVDSGPGDGGTFWLRVPQPL